MQLFGVIMQEKPVTIGNCYSNDFSYKNVLKQGLFWMQYSFVLKTLMGTQLNVKVVSFSSACYFSAD